MNRTDMHQRIAALKAEALPPLTWRDIFTPAEGADPPSADDQSRLDDYLKIFVAWPKDKDGHTLCVCCRKVVRSGIMGALLGGAPDSTTFKYGIAHGECFCASCGWPARANHYDIGGKGDDALIRNMTLTLLYHPSGIEPRAEEPAQED